MWDSSKLRVKSSVRTKKESAVRRQQSKLRSLNLSLKVVEGEIRPLEPGGRPAPSQQVDAASVRIVLNEFSPFGTRLFSTESFYPGQKIALTLRYPRVVYITGQVRCCVAVTSPHRVLGEGKFSYRAVVTFDLKTPEDRQNLLSFCSELSHEHGIHFIEPVGGAEGWLPALLPQGVAKISA